MKTNRLSLILALTLGLSPAAFAQAKTFTGEIVDSPCAAMGSHEHMMKAEKARNARECTLACIKAHGALVLCDAANKKVYKLDDQVKAKTFAGKKVMVTGEYDDALKAIRLQSIKAAGK